MPEVMSVQPPGCRSRPSSRRPISILYRTDGQRQPPDIKSVSLPCLTESGFEQEIDMTIEKYGMHGYKFLVRMERDSEGGHGATIELRLPRAGHPDGDVVEQMTVTAEHNTEQKARAAAVRMASMRIYELLTAASLGSAAPKD